MEELSLTLTLKDGDIPSTSLSETTKSSAAGILLFLSSIRETTPPLLAHHTTPGEVLTPFPHSVVSQFLSTLMSFSILRLLNALDTQRELNTMNNHTPPPCSQEKLSISTQPLDLTRLLTRFSAPETREEDKFLLLSTRLLMSQSNFGSGTLLPDLFIMPPIQTFVWTGQMDSMASILPPLALQPIKEDSITLLRTNSLQEMAMS